jgi:hypothetical protein
MARSSGAVTPSGGIEKYPATLEHGGTRLTISSSNGTATVSFQGGARTLDYFLGSGAVGRSYLSSVDGFLFQAPVSWYSNASRWALSPGFEKFATVNLMRPVEPGCLRCHASGIQHVTATTNRYRNPPFAEPGVSCERCHGPGAAHIARIKSGQRGGIVNPARLEPARRDSVCAQCHLSGATEISRAGGAAAFQAGELLSDRSVTFVWSDSRWPMPVISHFERMSRSRCRQAAPERFWCGTCHNPHTPVADPAGYYRAKCLTCHAAGHCNAAARSRQAVADACTSCHMPRTSAVSVQHAAFTDHSIPRRAGDPSGMSMAVDGRLEPFGGVKATDAEMALAWADVALRENNRTWGMQAFQLLQAVYSSQPDDARVATQLAQLFDRMGQERKACEIYARVLKIQPEAIAAAINLGTCLAKENRLEESMRLWADVLGRSPGHEGARLNLAVAQTQTGNTAAARSTLSTALTFNPLSSRARELLSRLNSADDLPQK